VTAQIKALEYDLGAELFVRDRRGVALTEAGKRFHKYARQIVDLSRDGKEAVQNSPKTAGTITIGVVETISTYRLPAFLFKIQERAPEIKISFKIMSDKQLYESIKMGTLDIAFLVEQDLVVTNTVVKKICDEPVSLFVRPDHPLVGKDFETSDLGSISRSSYFPFICCLWEIGYEKKNLGSIKPLPSGQYSFGNKKAGHKVRLLKILYFISLHNRVLSRNHAC